MDREPGAPRYKSKKTREVFDNADAANTAGFSEAVGGDDSEARSDEKPEAKYVRVNPGDAPDIASPSFFIVDESADPTDSILEPGTGRRLRRITREEQREMVALQLARNGEGDSRPFKKVAEPHAQRVEAPLSPLEVKRRTLAGRLAKLQLEHTWGRLNDEHALALSPLREYIQSTAALDEQRAQMALEQIEKGVKQLESFVTGEPIPMIDPAPVEMLDLEAELARARGAEADPSTPDGEPRGEGDPFASAADRMRDGGSRTLTAEILPLSRVRALFWKHLREGMELGPCIWAAFEHLGTKQERATLCEEVIEAGEAAGYVWSTFNNYPHPTEPARPARAARPERKGREERGRDEEDVEITPAQAKRRFEKASPDTENDFQEIYDEVKAQMTKSKLLEVRKWLLKQGEWLDIDVVKKVLDADESFKPRTKETAPENKERGFSEKELTQMIAEKRARLAALKSGS